ncbi:MAG: hypothetical protein IPK68_23330 [Bdellovibrionales bacterium]|jgi:hypothetical protein|nr:hypothetical protein [Bdellovibrionales bacterium]
MPDKDKISESTTVAELAAIVWKHLDKNNITAVLSGGSVVTIYTGANIYESHDLDFISPNDHQHILSVMKEIGFEPITKYNKNLGHPNTKILVEFPVGPINFGGPPVRYENIEYREVAGEKIRMLSPTQSVMDRLLSFCSTGDIQGLDQAKWICERHPVNYSKIKAWAKRDGRANDNEFKKICDACEKGIKVFVERSSI